MINSSDSLDPFLFQFKTKTNHSRFNLHSKKKIKNSFDSKSGQNSFQSKEFSPSFTPNSPFKQNKNDNSPSELLENFLQNSLNSNSKKLHQQLKLFRFDQKIEEIQCQQIQQLIQQQIQTEKQTQLQKMIELLKKVQVHLNHSNAQRIYKRVNPHSKSYDFNQTNKISRFQNSQTQMDQKPVRTFSINSSNIKEFLKTKKDKMIINSLNLTKMQLDKPKHNPSFKPSIYIPLCKMNIFHQKIILKRKSSNSSMPRNLFFSKKPNSLFENLVQQNRPSESSHKLCQVQKSLLILKNESFSLKKNYEFFISKLKFQNPEAQKQLIQELKNTKQHERLLLDHNSKSFTGYNKIKSCANKHGLPEKSLKEEEKRQLEYGSKHKDLQKISCSKIHYLKPLRFKQLKKNQKEILLFDRLFQSKVNRKQQSKCEDSQSIYESSQSENQTTAKFKCTYNGKHDKNQIEKMIANRKVSREAVSPNHHQLSAWN